VNAGKDRINIKTTSVGLGSKGIFNKSYVLGVVLN
jgi:hypothetical protein